MNTFAFTTVDFFVIAILVISSTLGLIRGLVKELLSLVSFVVATYLAYEFSSQIALAWLEAIPIGSTGRMVLAFGLIFVVVLIVGKVLGNLISRVLSGAGLSFLDRVLGSGFGFLRGALIVVILSTLLAVTDLPKSNEWKDALSRPAVELVVGIVRHWLPDNWAQTLLQATDIRQLAK